MHNVHLTCDEPGCGWSIPGVQDDIPKFHNKPCPKCGKGIIVNDFEMELFKKICAKQVEKSDDSVLVHFDTSNYPALVRAARRKVKLSDKNWDKQCDYMEQTIPQLHEFLELWGRHCGAPRSVFRGHLCKLLIEAKPITPHGGAR